MITLGIDIGVSSLGTAIVDTEENKILHTGVYVFPAGKDAFGTSKEASKNETRRTARQGRRQNFRRKLRRVHLLKFLYQLSNLNSPEGDRYVPLTMEEIEGWIGWDKERKSRGRGFPDTIAMREWLALNPYEIRDKALRQDISRREFGRLLYHVILRRGFQSSRKVKDDGAMAQGSKKNGIVGYEETEEKVGKETLGQYLYSLTPKDGEPYTAQAEKTRGRYTLRRMYVEELDRIWQRQAPQLGLDGMEIEGKSVKERLIGQVAYDDESGKIKYKSNDSILFWQRPLRSQKGLINKCSLESRKLYDPKKKRTYIQGPRCAAISHPTAEFHRVLQALSQIKVEGRTLYQMGLHDLALDFLLSKGSKTVSVADLTSNLNLAAKLNYVGDMSLPGCPTIAGITALFAKGKLKYAYGDTDKIYETIWQKLSFYEDAEMLENNLRAYTAKEGLPLASDFCKKLAKLQLTDGYGSISIHAMNNIIPFLLKGHSHTESIFLGGVKNSFGSRYGYFEKEERMWKDLLEIINLPATKGEKIDNIIAYLCDPQNQLAFDSTDEEKLRLKLYHPTQSVQKIEVVHKLGPVDDLRNPIVQQALWAVRRQVNALIEMMAEQTGNPDFRFDRISIELARDLKASKDGRQRMRSQQEENKRENDEAAMELRARNVRINRENIQKYRLYKELQQEYGIAICPYTGKTISQTELFDGNNYFQIEHIIPLSVSLDDSFANKTLCESNFNRDKGNLTPYEFYSKVTNPNLWGAESWEEITQRVRRLLPVRKAARFLSKRSAEEQLTELPSKMLNDTAYMAVKVKEYLSTICADVRSVNGHITADLRHMWGLNNILSVPYKCLHGAVSDELISRGDKEVYAILNNETQMVREVAPKLTLIPNPKPDEVRIPVTIKGKKLYRGGKEINKPTYLELPNGVEDGILYFRSVGGTPLFEPLFNERPKALRQLSIPASINNKGQLSSDYMELLRGLKKDQYPKEPGKYWITMPIADDPYWELPSEKASLSSKAVRIAGKLNGNLFWSPIFEMEVSTSVVNLDEHRNRTALIKPEYTKAIFTKILRPAPATDADQLLLTGMVCKGKFVIDEGDDMEIDVSNFQLAEGKKYYAVLQYGIDCAPEEAVTLYPLKAKAPSTRPGETLIEGRLLLLDGQRDLFGIEPPKNRDDHRHHAIDALVIALCKQSYVTKLSTYNARHADSKKNKSEHPTFDHPWAGFRADADKSIKAILVYHKPKRVSAVTEVTKKITKQGKVYTSHGYAVRGALHEDTIYGCRKAPNQKDYSYHKREEIVKITSMGKLKRVVDDAIRSEMLRILKEEYHLNINNSDLMIPSRAFIDENGNTKVYLPNRRGEPVPVKKVRVRENSNTIIRIKEANQYVEPGNNHHVLIYESLDGSMQESVVTFKDATDRQIRGEELFQLPPDGKRIIFKLMISQMYLIGITRKEIEENIHNSAFLSNFLYKVISISSKDYRFLLAKASNDKNNTYIIRKRTPNDFHFKKDNIHAVELNLTGQIKLI